MGKSRKKSGESKKKTKTKETPINWTAGGETGANGGCKCLVTRQ